MVMAAVAMAALCSQAVAFSWSGKDACNQENDWYAADGSKVYLFAAGLALNGTELITAADVTAAAISAAVADGSFMDWTSKAVGITEVTGGEGNFEGAAGSFTGKNSGDAVSMFAVIVEDKSYGSDVMAVYIPGTQGTADAAFNATTGLASWKMGDLETATAGNWVAQSVPEPTSGLLLLFGVAGLALRRRRA